MSDNVVSRDQGEAPGVNFPVELYRANEDGTGKSVSAETPKDMADFMRAGYMPGAKPQEPAPEKKASTKKAKKRSAKPPAGGWKK